MATRVTFNGDGATVTATHSTASKEGIAKALASAKVTDLQGRTYLVSSVDYEEADGRRPAGWFAKLSRLGLRTWEPLDNLTHYKIEPDPAAAHAALSPVDVQSLADAESTRRSQ